MRGEAARKLPVALPFVSSASDPSTIRRSASTGRHGPKTYKIIGTRQVEDSEKS